MQSDKTIQFKEELFETTSNALRRTSYLSSHIQKIHNSKNESFENKNQLKAYRLQTKSKPV